MADIRDDLEHVIFGLPKPVSEADVLAAAETVLGTASTKFNQFSRWFEQNGVVLLRRLNG